MSTTEQTKASDMTSLPFRTEVQQVLQILAHSLYSNREVFLRELISNASDALHRLQFEMLTNSEVRDLDAELAIHIDADESAKTITISDTGIGMTREEIVEQLGTIAHSSARALIEQLEATQRGDIIGQFGVGFYSVFMVAEEVTVVSRSYRPDAETVQWISSGGNTFTVGPAEREQRGTTITLKLKDDAAEFASSWKLRQIIKRHSDFVAFPVYLGKDNERINEKTAIWRQSPRQVEAEQYQEFYRQLTLDFTEPLLHIHLSTEAPIDLHAILFVPGKRDRYMRQFRPEGNVKLYSRKVLIQEETKDLLPRHYRFIEGVVDSEDLPLNVSRETIQSGQLIERIRKALVGRLTKELAELSDKDPEKYATFWDEYGVFIKEGVATDTTARPDLLPLLRFHTTKSADTLVSLADYKSRMAEDQKEIYYVLADNLESARRSPHLDVLTEQGLEALLLVDVMDAYMMDWVREYDELRFRNVADPELKLPGESTQPEPTISDDQFVKLVERVKDVLGERVNGVRDSGMLRTNPARLVAENAGSLERERIQQKLDPSYKVAPKILELNRSHTLIANLTRMLEQNSDDPLITPLIEQLYDNALLLEGLHPNPAELAGRIQLLMETLAKKGQPET